jgi:UDP-N-acetylglucosamine 1-carboxyvinyltransferase
MSKLLKQTRCFYIEGGTPLNGHVAVEGAKNAVLPLLAASLLTDEPVILHNVPAVDDVSIMTSMLRHFGKQIEHDGSTYRIAESGLAQVDAPYPLVRLMRASFIVLGPLLARAGRASVPLPGGCILGPRPVDFHTNGLKALGATVDLREGVVHAEASQLHGGNLYLDFPSVGATQHLLMTASLIPDKTVIHNPAQEPEVHELIHLLTLMGAQIEATPNRIEIVGKAKLSGATYQVIPDRLNAGTYLMAGAMTGGDIVVDCIPAHIESLLVKLQESGFTINQSDSDVHLVAPSSWNGMQVVTGPYPAFANDLQPQIMALMTLARGDSLIRETVFKDRFGQVAELARMGAQIQAKGDTALVQGVDQLEGTEVQATDIRSGAALVIAGMAARGQTRVIDEGHTARGYVDFAEKLTQLGARIEVETL